MSRAVRPARDAGFTLVEAMVSLFVFALISAGAVMLLIQGVRGQETLNRVDAELRDIQMTQAVLAADMGQLASRVTRRPDNTIAPRFAGGGESGTVLAFVRLASDDAAANGSGRRLQYVEYVVREGALIRRARETLDALPETPMSERVLLRDAIAVRVLFFTGRDWVGEWRPPTPAITTVPRAVAIEADHRTRGPLRIAAMTGLGS